MKIILASLFAVVLAASGILVPDLRGPLNDEAKIFDKATARAVEDRILRFNETTHAQLAVLTVPSLQDADIETFSIAVAEKWKLGDAKRDDGLLFLIAPAQRKMRIEVGHGLEGDVTDIAAKRILSDRVAPLFRRGDLAGGVIAGIDSLEDYVLKREAPPTEIDSNHSKRPAWLPFLLVFLAIFVIWIYDLLFGGPRNGRRNSWSSWDNNHWGGGGGGGFGGFGGGSGGGGFSGGGGSFGGGGASSDW